MERKRLLAIVDVIAPVAVGAAIYLFLRPPGLLIFGWIDALGLGPTLVSMRSILAPAARATPTFVLFSVPNALWAYAFTAAMSHAWSHRWNRSSAPWILLGPAITIGAEIGQALGVVPGTFDAIDLVLELIACALALRHLWKRYRGHPGRPDRFSEDTRSPSS